MWGGGACGNMPALISFLSSHSKSLYAILSCGMARRHRGNPAASLRVEALYCAPRLYSGLSTLLLSPAEIAAVSAQQKTTLEQLQRLYPRTPAPAVHLLSGTIPAAGVLHMRQLGLLLMIAKLGPSNILHRHALYILHHGLKNSWFCQIREISLRYSLPDPMVTLTSPPSSKSLWKKSVKTAVCQYWHRELAAKAASLPSLCHLRAPFLPLGRGPHPLWWTCGSSASANRAATVQARMLSGRYRSDWQRRHWGPGETGACRLPSCSSQQGDLEHLLTAACPALASALARTLQHCTSFLSSNPVLLSTVQAALAREPGDFVSFVLDPSTDRAVLALVQQHDSSILAPLFRFSRAWIWAAHRDRMRLLGLHQYLV